MRALCALAIATSITALALTGEVRGQAQWQPVTGVDGSFTMEMPGAPEYAPKEKATPRGTVYTSHQNILDQGSKVYVAVSALYRQDVDLSDPKASHELYLDAYAKALDGGKWLSVDWVTHEGFEAVGTAKDLDVRIYSVIMGHRPIDLSYHGPLGTGPSDDVNRFIGSLKIGGEVKPQLALPPTGPTPLQRDRP
jgi:hypothetical protein